MATITAITTLAEARAAYFANCSYAEEGSLAMARAFESALIALQGMLPKKTTSGGPSGESVEFDLQRIDSRLVDVRAWIAASSPPEDGGSGTVHYSLEDLRS